jgi:hypothetical protein
MYGNCVRSARRRFTKGYELASPQNSPHCRLLGWVYRKFLACKCLKRLAPQVGPEPTILRFYEGEMSREIFPRRADARRELVLAFQPHSRALVSMPTGFTELPGAKP